MKLNRVKKLNRDNTFFFQITSFCERRVKIIKKNYFEKKNFLNTRNLFINKKICSYHEKFVENFENDCAIVEL